MGPRAGLDGYGKSRPPPTGIRSPERPARSESLYRLSYCGRMMMYVPLCYTTDEPLVWFMSYLTILSVAQVM